MWNWSLCEINSNRQKIIATITACVTQDDASQEAEVAKMIIFLCPEIFPSAIRFDEKLPSLLPPLE
jgi:hypothetical protein